VEQRLERLQRLFSLERQAALERFMHVHTCFSRSEASLEQKVAGLQQMLAGSAWTAGQLVMGQPTLLGAHLAGCHASRLPDACMLRPATCLVVGLASLSPAAALHADGLVAAAQAVTWRG
jgi:hypothetical protein